MAEGSKGSSKAKGTTGQKKKKSTKKKNIISTSNMFPTTEQGWIDYFSALAREKKGERQAKLDAALEELNTQVDIKTKEKKLKDLDRDEESEAIGLENEKLDLKLKKLDLESKMDEKARKDVELGSSGDPEFTEDPIAKGAASRLEQFQQKIENAQIAEAERKKQVERRMMLRSILHGSGSGTASTRQLRKLLLK